MATKKPKSSAKSKAKTTTKPKTAAKTETPVSEAPKTNTEVVEKATATVVTAKTSPFKGFFSRKYEEKESILTIFKNPKFYGALLGEVIGTLMLTLLLFACSLMGIHSTATYAFALVAVLVAVYAFSGACLNPIVTVGMMATRRMSVIRGVMYIIAEIIGAWLGWLIFNSFHLAGGDSAYALAKMADIEEGKFWIMAMVELMGSVIIAFCFARALKYKRSVFTFAATVAGGIVLAYVVSYVISLAFFSINSGFIMNPAAALMLQIFPTSGENFGEIMGGVMQALSLWVILPMLGGVCGFYIADFTGKLSGEE